MLGASSEVTRGGAEQSWKTQRRKQTIGARLNWGEDTLSVGLIPQGEISADSACQEDMEGQGNVNQNMSSERTGVSNRCLSVGSPRTAPETKI